MAPRKFVPVITTVAPGIAADGAKPVIAGNGITKSVADVAVRPFTVTFSLPVVAPAGTIARSVVAVEAMAGAATVLKMIILLEALVLKFVPVISTTLPAMPDVGVNELIVGAPGITTTVKSPSDVAIPFAVPTLIFPVVAPAGTVTVSDVD